MNSRVFECVRDVRVLDAMSKVCVGYDFENGVKTCTETLCVTNVANVVTNVVLVDSVRVVREYARVGVPA
jgi:hypothetical protein